MLGGGTCFRPGQWEAIEQLVVHRSRVLLVQRTGWGKSLVYFIATKLGREAGDGPTLLVSPLLSLMRDQQRMAEAIGVRAQRITSDNKKAWDEVERSIADNACDLLLIAPERLYNPRFLQDVLPTLRGGIGLLVVDEAHCISDWGHDFRPDYRRIVGISQNLPRDTPVLATTATANDRVIEDIRGQLGIGLSVLRGPLARGSLRLQNLRLSDQAERLAWLTENLPKFRGTGIVYCLTIADTERVAKWLQGRGINAQSYHGNLDGEKREALEGALLDNQVTVLVATVALGMGFDKRDLAFVVHFQRPGSVVAYYQQVGRAGRQLDRAYGILLSGREDDEIVDYFIDSAFPPLETMREILEVLAEGEGLKTREILDRMNISFRTAERALKLLEVDGAVRRDQGRLFRTANPWKPDVERIQRVTELRRREQAEMQRYVDHPGCLMEFLSRALDDPASAPCGQCANCQGRGFSATVSAELVEQAIQFLRRENVVIEARKRWADNTAIPPEERTENGRALCYYGDAGWGRLVPAGKYRVGRFEHRLVAAAVELVRERWRPDPPPQWVTAIPSLRHPCLVFDLAQRLAAGLGLPFVAALERTRAASEQKLMENSSMQARNVQQSLVVRGPLPAGPLLLVDDIVDSRWTMTIAGSLLRRSGSGAVYPFALARATRRGT
jgi:ATP-dependent DNA helicase RecQ